MVSQVHTICMSMTCKLIALRSKMLNTLMMFSFLDANVFPTITAEAAVPYTLPYCVTLTIGASSTIVLFGFSILTCSLLNKWLGYTSFLFSLLLFPAIILYVIYKEESETLVLCTCAQQVGFLFIVSLLVAVLSFE